MDIWVQSSKWVQYYFQKYRNFHFCSKTLKKRNQTYFSLACASDGAPVPLPLAYMALFWGESSVMDVLELRAAQGGLTLTLLDSTSTHTQLRKCSLGFLRLLIFEQCCSVLSGRSSKLSAALFSSSLTHSAQTAAETVETPPTACLLSSYKHQPNSLLPLDTCTPSIQ